MPLALLTFHHFHSPRKLAALQTLTRRLPATSALYLRGRPGALLVSAADATTLAEYVKAVKRLRWQRVHVLGVSAEPGHGLRAVPVGAMVPVLRVAGLVQAAGEAGAWVGERLRTGFAAGGLR